jgi:hypothetical protein
MTGKSTERLYFTDDSEESATLMAHKKKAVPGDSLTSSEEE